MSNTITVTWKNGKQWRLRRDLVERFAEKEEDELPVPAGWLKDKEKDLWFSLVRMERAGIAIDNEITTQFR